MLRQPRLDYEDNQHRQEQAKFAGEDPPAAEQSRVDDDQNNERDAASSKARSHGPPGCCHVVIVESLLQRGPARVQEVFEASSCRISEC